MSQGIKFSRIIILLLVGLAALLYIFANTGAEIFALADPIVGIEPAYDVQNSRLFVKRVVANGPAAVAGIKAGDQITALNGVEITSDSGLLQLLKTVDASGAHQITVNRDGSPLQISIQTRRRYQVDVEFTFFRLLPLIIFCYTLCLIGFFVFFRRLNQNTAHVFYLMVLSWAMAMWKGFPFGTDALSSFLPSWFGYIEEVFWPIAIGLLLHFSLVFPEEKPVFRRHRGLFWFVMYGSVLLLPANFVISWLLKRPVDILSIGWGSWFGINFGLACYMIGRTVREAKSPNETSQAKLIYRATLLTLALPTGIHFLPRLLAGVEVPYSDYALLISVFWPLLLAYAIVRHRLMDTGFIIRRGVAYALVSGFVIAIYFLIVVGLGQLVLNLTGTTSQLITIFATLLIAAIFNPVKNQIQAFVERRFFADRYYYREAARELRHHLVNVVDLDKLTELLLSFFSRQMKITKVALLWNMSENSTFEIRESRGFNGRCDVQFSKEDFVIGRLRSKQRLIDLTAVRDATPGLSESERSQWSRLETELALPLFAKGKLNGFVSLGLKDEDEPYYKEDIDLLEALGDQINISLENALLTEELREQERLRKELEVARRIQLSSLPQQDPQIEGLDISGMSKPAMEVGGDYYDYIRLADKRFGVVVGDVSGKGTSAALYMSQLKGILKTASGYHTSLKKLISEVNNITCENIEEQSFITMACAVFDVRKQKMNLVRAGHLPVMYYSPDEQKCTHLTPRGIGVGLATGELFEKELQELTVKFNPGDIFLFYSDGVTEATDELGNEYTIEMIEKLVRACSCESAAQIRELLMSEVEAFAGSSRQRDDMTIVVVKIS
jgi:serine phosphatase RsbU (regulator of sigma subunit)